MRHLLKYACIAACLTTFSTASQAQNADYLSFGVGWWDINDDQDAVDMRVEYRPAIPVLVENLNPWIGAELTSDGSVWGGGGLLYDWEISPQWHVVPNFGAGLYAQGGSDKDLGHVIEFRSQLEVAYEFETAQRLGVSIGHLSNASLDDNNPGTEVLNLYYHVPW